MNRQEILDYFKAHPSQTPYLMRLGEKGKAKILISASMHGNEPCGAKAMVDVHQQLKKTAIDGEIIFLLGNPQAFIHNVRYVDVDLNRSFGQDQKQTVEGQRVAEIDQFLEKEGNFEAVLDLHSTSLPQPPMLIYSAEDLKAQQFALNISSLNLHFAYHSEHIRGIFVEHCQTDHHLVVECGTHDDPKSSQIAENHIWSVLSHFGLHQDSSKVHPVGHDVTYYESVQSIRPGPGFHYTQTFHTGDFLAAGAAFARDDNRTYQATEDCYIVLPHKKIRPEDTDAGFLCLRKILNP